MINAVIGDRLLIPANRASSVEKYLKKSLADLQLSYIDLYLIHCPFAMPDTDGDFHREANGDLVLDTETDHLVTWKVNIFLILILQPQLCFYRLFVSQKLEEYVGAGLIKNIGISNFNQRQIQRILDNCTIRPACLQIELHVYLQQQELVDFCHANNIAVVAYSPLGSRGFAAALNLQYVVTMIVHNDQSLNFP